MNVGELNKVTRGLMKTAARAIIDSDDKPRSCNDANACLLVISALLMNQVLRFIFETGYESKYDKQPPKELIDALDSDFQKEIINTLNRLADTVGLVFDLEQFRKDNE
jgi:hypothetical protein